MLEKHNYAHFARPSVGLNRFYFFSKQTYQSHSFTEFQSYQLGNLFYYHFWLVIRYKIYRIIKTSDWVISWNLFELLNVLFGNYDVKIDWNTYGTIKTFEAVIINLDEIIRIFYVVFMGSQNFWSRYQMENSWGYRSPF